MVGNIYFSYSMILPRYSRKRAPDWKIGSPCSLTTQMVAGVRNAPNTPVLVLPYRFELIREVAA